LTLIETLRSARHIAVLTGAGISAESGVPTFRDALTGLWSNFKPEDLATVEAFTRNPKMVWDWYAFRRKMVNGVKPNLGHFALVEIERRAPKFSLFTQNVDGLHQRAGSTRVVELHGSISRVKCLKEDTPVESWTEDGEAPPRCPRCGALLRPDVVWFGELLPPRALEEAHFAAIDCDVFFSIGTSALVHPAASLPMDAKRSGAAVIEINPDDTPLTPHASFSLRGPSGVVLPKLVAEAWPLHY
jgi:NAD-dependent deacetylase